MHRPVTEYLRYAWVSKVVTAVVLAAFLSLTLQPLAIAAQLPARPATAQATATDPSAQLAQTLEATEAKLGELIDDFTAGRDAGPRLQDVKQLHQQLKTLDQAALQSFTEVETHLKAKALPPVILDRHTDAVKSYTKDFQTLTNALTALEAAPDTPGRKQHAEVAFNHLKEKQKKKPHTPVDPNNLPTRALKPDKNNVPKLTKEQFRVAGLYDNPSVKLAALGDFTFDKLPGANDPAYLASTPEVVLSDAVKAKAAELEYNPVKIFNWIYANTEWLPTWGAIQNSDTALLAQKGNAFDLSSLLVALLRASGIPSRYVHGTIEIPADKFMNWAGGFTDPNGAWELASAAGIPITAVTSGGKIVAFRMEHIWVEAAIDFYPSRGAINKSADSWIQLDPSFKQYVGERGYDMHALLNFDADQFMSDYITNGADKTPSQHYSKKILDYLEATIPDWTLEGLYGHERVDPIKPVTGGNLRLLASSLPYKVMARGYTAGGIPDALRHKVTIEIANSPTVGFDATYTIALTELALDRLTLSYIPESAADDAVVDDYGTLFASPAYLVRVKPVLRKAGVTVAVGAGTTLGKKQTVMLSFQSSTLTINPVVNEITAGSYSAIIFQGTESTSAVPSVHMQQLTENAELNELGQVEFDDLLGQLLHAIGVQWFFSLVYERDFYRTTMQVSYTRLPSEMIATADLTVSYWFGIPRTASPGPFTVDADQDVLAVAPIAGDTRRTIDFMLLAGMTGSAWEHIVFEGFFNTTAVSSMKLLRAAADHGIPIHKINSGNIAQIIPLLSLAPEDITDIQNGTAAGKEVIVSQTEVQVGTYRGVGILILDPQRGSGLYLISGGLAGGYAFKLEEWKKDVYNKAWASLTVRNLVLGTAERWVGMPYGFGCKDPLTQGPQPGRCGRDQDGTMRIDCSGFVESVYFRVGFRFFVRKNAQGQYDFVKANFNIPTAASVLFGDLIFFENTYDKNDNKNYTDDGVTHVGIVDKPQRWIAAEANKVEAYCTAAYKAANPSDSCVLSGLWPGKTANFFSYGSVVGYGRK